MAGIASINQAYNYSGLSFQNGGRNDNKFSSAPQYTAVVGFSLGG
jgi:hypothetical protein